MNATATKPSTIVDDLYVYRIDARHFGVENRRELFAEHVVYMDHAGELHCDSDCPAYRRNFRCSHVASTLRFLRNEVKRVDLSDVPVFALEDVPVKISKVTGKPIRDLESIFPES